MIELTFSRPPPSENALYYNRKPGATNRNGKKLRGRGITKELAAWRKEIGWEILLQKQKPIHGPVRVIMTFGTAAIDLPNLLKASMDVLVSQRLIDDDGPSIVQWLSMALDDKLTGAKLTVMSN